MKDWRRFSHIDVKIWQEWEEYGFDTHTETPRNSYKIITMKNTKVIELLNAPMEKVKEEIKRIFDEQ